MNKPLGSKRVKARARRGPRRTTASRPTSARQLEPYIDSPSAGSLLSVERTIREVREARLGMLHSTINLARTLLVRARASRSTKVIARSLQHAREEFTLATRLLAANTMGPAQTASVRGELAALREELEHAERAASRTVR